ARGGWARARGRGQPERGAAPPPLLYSSCCISCSIWVRWAASVLASAWLYSDPKFDPVPDLGGQCVSLYGAVGSEPCCTWLRYARVPQKSTEKASLRYWFP